MTEKKPRQRKPKPNPVDVLINDRPQSVWIEVGSMKIYVRTTDRFLEGKRLRMFDISNVDIANDKKKGKGEFTAFLDDLELRKPFGGVHVENVLNPRLEAFLERHGFTKYNYDIGPPCFYKLWDQPKTGDKGWVVPYEAATLHVTDETTTEDILEFMNAEAAKIP